MSVNPGEFVWAGGGRDAQQHAFTARWQRQRLSLHRWIIMAKSDLPPPPLQNRAAFIYSEFFEQFVDRLGSSGEM